MPEWDSGRQRPRYGQRGPIAGASSWRTRPPQPHDSYLSGGATAMADIELNGDDLRRDPLEVRKATLVSVLAKAGPGTAE
jgi:hypothetical protein